MINLVERAKKLILKPREEWAVINGETHTVTGLYTQYVMILSAIPAIASFIGFSFIGYTGYAKPIRIDVGPGLASMVLSYVLGLGAVYAIALVIDHLAPNFGGEKDFMQALKVAAFFPTASWLAGVFYLIPALYILGLVGSLYSLYLLMTGLEPLMKVPEDKSISYTAVVVIVAIVMMVVISVLGALVIPSRSRGF